jgi:2,3-bisphosphoglycerate-independent phosphoglycerate mutase
MKYVIVIPDGAADAPQDSLGGKTPFQAARTPDMDSLAARGTVGLTNHVPDSLPPGSEVACMSLMGYDPLAYFTGRAPLEAAAQGISLGADDWAVRCNLVTIQPGDGEPIMEDFTAGHITTEEATELLAAAQRGLAADFPGLSGWEFKPGVSYRNLLLHRGRPGAAPLAGDLRATPPHDLMDKPVGDSFPRGTGSRLLTEIMARSATWLEGHPVNKARIAAGKRPATHVWLWGVGRAPAMEPFAQKYGMSGTMITAVDLLRGLAALAGWKRLEVPGATGYLDTDYAAKGRYAIAELDRTEDETSACRGMTLCLEDQTAVRMRRTAKRIRRTRVRPPGPFLRLPDSHGSGRDPSAGGTRTSGTARRVSSRAATGRRSRR